MGACAFVLRKIHPPLSMERWLFPQSASCPEPLPQCPSCSMRGPRPGQPPAQDLLRKGHCIYSSTYLTYTYGGFCRVLDLQFWLSSFPYPSVSELSGILLHVCLYSSHGQTPQLRQPSMLCLLLAGLTPDLTFVLTFDLAKIFDSGCLWLFCSLSSCLGSRQVSSVPICFPKLSESSTQVRRGPCVAQFLWLVV